MQLKNVNKSIGKKKIIKDLSFEIYPGEVFGFLGPNGAGKTTTIRMMVGLMKISAGDILINGVSVSKNYKQAVRQVGAIVENPEMYPFMSGWKNLKHFARMIPGITDERIKEVIALVGLEKAIHEKVGKYSLGMRQRIGVAQALLHNPSILILDEPTNGLDPAGIREIRQYIRKLAEEENVAVIVSSHLLSEIELMCDRIGIIKNGELVTVEKVADESNEDQDLQVLIEVSPIDTAVKVIEDAFNISASIEENKLAIKTKKEIIPQIIQELVKHQLEIYEVVTNNASLEDKFFEMIGENTIA
ncbi:ABC transporter ATP-binding protein [Gracilibacillus dipsosauri]|uniref:Bacitracin ABC transporter ATP-binding protein n=1 Tax=Gracilibacillus dipsosauri TaxID=178340 RepID=A0A317KX89_9BACI|nr:ABC transporter ATP-binding protein [Gracilibacillus dipsosauri]PWU68095.1 bacitracin ABC transporter ATP-binding protein [Gracilibacillus dipsosauri]